MIIPTRGRPQKAAACVRALSAQTMEPGRYEVLVGLDGADPETEQLIERAWPRNGRGLHVVTCPRKGYNATRNRLLEQARGRTIVSVNDDVTPDPELLAVHAREQGRAVQRDRPAVIVGHSPWARPEPERLFDRLVRETSMVFFYDRMDNADPDHDWGFRHAWGLNVSMPADSVMEIGGWTAFDRQYGYDDIEIAWRLHDRFGLPVLYRPDARAVHHHRMEPRGYLQREFQLGRAAWMFARHNPGFARDLFDRDITAADELCYCREFVHRERAAAFRVLASFERLAGLDAGVVDGPHAATLIDAIYEQHLPLKRWMWRRGVIAAADGRPPAEIDWP